MFGNKATTVGEYLAGLTPERRAAIERVRAHVNRHVPDGYQEGILFGSINWFVPLSVYPDTYNGQPLCYAALAAQKAYCSLYLMNAYGDPALAAKLQAGFRAAGKKLDMGKSCIRFKAVDDLALDVIGEVIGATPMANYVAAAELVRNRKKRPAKTAAKKKVAARKKTATKQSRRK